MEVQSLALLVANYVVQEVVFYSTIVIPRSDYQQPLVLLVLVARRGEATSLRILNTSQHIAVIMIQTRLIIQTLTTKAVTKIRSYRAMTVRSLTMSIHN